MSGPATELPGNNAVIGFNANGGRVVQIVNVGGIQNRQIIGNVLAVKGATNTNLASGLGLPILEDAKGMALDLEQVSQMQTMLVNGRLTQEVTMVFCAGTGVGEPTRMVLYGHRMMTVTVPFRFEDVPLP